MSFDYLSKMISRLSLLALALSTAVGATECQGQYGPKLGAVASESSICSRIGTRLIEDGGNAVDALAGTVFCIGTVAMYHSGIGGGGFALLRSSNGSYEFVDFRETAPAAAFQDMYKGNVNASIFGGLASGIPGEVRGLEYLHKTHGVLKWAEVLAPSVKLARFGFPVTEDLVKVMDAASPNAFLVDDPSWALDFAPRGRRVRLGETMTRKRYADTLETIAMEGADAFYTGAIAKATIRALKAGNGTMTEDDLKKYTIAHRKPIEIKYRGYKVTSTNAPSGGVVALSALDTLSGLDHFADPSHSNTSAHFLVEAIKWGYGERTKLGDPSFVPGLDELTKRMISAEAGAEIRSKISQTQTFGVSYYDPDGIESLDTPGTSHIVAADASGLTVSLTTTVNLFFGSNLMVPETGIIMNNEMNDFSIPGASNAFGFIPSEANFVRPGKRPQSSISPIIAETSDGKVFFAIGAAGGSRIITANIQNAIHLLDGRMSIAEALAQPRLHNQLVPAQVTFEYAYNNGTVSYLKSLGDNVTWVAPGQSSAQGLTRLADGSFAAAGEPRQKNSGGFAE